MRVSWCHRRASESGHARGTSVPVLPVNSSTGDVCYDTSPRQRGTPIRRHGEGRVDLLAGAGASRSFSSSFLYILSCAAQLLRVDERAGIFRLSRLSMALINPGAAGNGPGLIWLLPITKKPVKMLPLWP